MGGRASQYFLLSLLGASDRPIVSLCLILSTSTNQETLQAFA